MPLAKESIVLKPAELRLVRRDDSSNWQAHFKVKGVRTWVRKTTNTNNVSEAASLAERFYMKATFDFEDGRPVITRRFRSVAAVVILGLEEQIRDSTALVSYKEYITALKLYHIPFFGAHYIDNITPALISEFHAWRRDQLGRELSASAQNTHNVAMNRVFDLATEKGYMNIYQRPPLKNTGHVGDRRAEFSHDEIIKLMQCGDSFIANARMAKTKLIRELLTIYVPFMAATGIRPGTEAEFLEWRHIDVEIRDGQPILHFRLQRGKRGARNLIAHHSCWLLLEKLKAQSPDLAHLSLNEVLKKRFAKRLFRLSDGTAPHELNKSFRQWLLESGLLQCPVTSKERTLYSLRHYYATQRLLEGIPIHDLAQQMGTSVQMITKHYSHLTPLMKAKQFAGVIGGEGSLNGSGESELIKTLMNSQMANNNILSMVQASTHLSLPLIVQSVVLTQDFTKRLEDAQQQQVQVI